MGPKDYAPNTWQMLRRFLIFLLIFSAILLTVPLKFIGPEFARCTGSANCEIEKTTQWKWFGLYHIFIEPVSDANQVIHNNKYTLTSDSQYLVAGIGSLLVAGMIYLIPVKLFTRHISPHD